MNDWSSEFGIRNSELKLREIKFLKNYNSSFLYPLILSPYDVHIFYGDTNNFLDFIPYFKTILSDDEISKAESFYKQEGKEKAFISRGLLRIILSQYLAIKPEKIKFIYNQKGKPDLDSKTNSIHLKFNLSHKNQYIIYGFSLRNIGIDLELIDKNKTLLPIAKRFFTEEEYQYLKSLDNPKQNETFYQFWTKKEAYLKAIGEGLSGGLNTINFVTMNHPQWDINNFYLIDNYIGAYCVAYPFGFAFQEEKEYNYYALELSREILKINS